VALIIGTIEIVSIIGAKAGIESGPISVIANLDLNYVGFVIVGLFVVTWLVALGIYRAAHVEEKWTARLADSPGTD
jgi:high-affinity nickel-transport protein